MGQTDVIGEKLEMENVNNHGAQSWRRDDSSTDDSSTDGRTLGDGDGEDDEGESRQGSHAVQSGGHRGQ